MMKKGIRVEFIVGLLLGVGIFNSCTQSLVNPFRSQDFKSEAEIYAMPRIQTPEGNYLAGRIAQMRQDYGKAADYYAKAVDLGYTQSEVVERAYLLMLFEGRIDEAYQYAQKAREGDTNYIINFLNMTYLVSQSEFDAAKNSLAGIEEETYKNAIFPPFYAWMAAGKGDYKGALKALKPLLGDRQLHTMYYMHSGLIHEYFGKPDEALKAYETVVSDTDIELSFRSLQIICNFYLRNGYRLQAADLINKYYLSQNKPFMLAVLYKQVQDDSFMPQPLIDTPRKGVAEALFNTGTAFRPYQLQIAQLLTIFSIYLNPEHDIARASLADLFESSGQLDKSCSEYAQIDKSSPIYFMAKFKLANIYMSQEQYTEALEQLLAIYKENPKNFQVLFNLGDLYRVMDQHENAIKYYKQARQVLPPNSQTEWTVLYAMGISYERNNQWQKAEDVLQEALKVSHRHPLVLNYLGYSWLKINKNPNEALYMIFEAYRQNPEDAYIMDSLGWALFKMGKYDDAIKVLERAAEYLPDHAVVCDHLGDAYWQVGRKNEAEYQWKHALTLKDDSHEINPKTVERKLSEGLETPQIIPFNETLLVERLKTLDAAQ